MVNTDAGPLFDGLAVATEAALGDIRESGVDAVHVTVGDFMAPFGVVRRQILAWNDLLEAEAGELFAIRTAGDVDRIGVDDRTGVMYGLQNASLLESVDHVDELFELGLRVLQLTYNDANYLADGCVETRDAGLSRFGERVVQRCNEVGMIVDLSHVGSRSAQHATAISSRPVVMTHVNRRALVPTPRNHLDETLLGVVDGGGIVGISCHGTMIWDRKNKPTPASWAQLVTGMVDLVGPDAVAIGTDSPTQLKSSGLNGATARALARWPELFKDYTDAFGDSLESRYAEGLNGLSAWKAIPGLLSAQGLSDETVRKICGKNWMGFFRQQLPAS